MLFVLPAEPIHLRDVMQYEEPAPDDGWAIGQPNRISQPRIRAVHLNATKPFRVMHSRRNYVSIKWAIFHEVAPVAIPCLINAPLTPTKAHRTSRCSRSLFVTTRRAAARISA